MGDRCYLRLYVHGHIETMASLTNIVTAIEAEGFVPEYFGGERWSVLETFAMAATEQLDTPEFYMDECNYANVEETEMMLQMCRVGYYISHGSGDEYPPAAKSWTPERGYFSTIVSHDGNAVVEVDDIARALTEEDPVAYIKQLILETRWANGMDMPAFSVSEEVKRELSKLIACKALGVGDEGRAA